MMTLNRQKPFGTVHGHALFAYEQDGMLFNHDGDQVDESGAIVKSDQAEAPRRGRPPRKVEDEQLDQQLKG